MEISDLKEAAYYGLFKDEISNLNLRFVYLEMDGDRFIYFGGKHLKSTRLDNKEWQCVQQFGSIFWRDVYKELLKYKETL